MQDASGSGLSSRSQASHILAWDSSNRQYINQFAALACFYLLLLLLMTLLRTDFHWAEDGLVKIVEHHLAPQVTIGLDL
jgi:hypothetical protein